MILRDPLSSSRTSPSWGACHFRIIKLGALVGDYVEIGCNTVLNPGTVIGRNTTVYPLSRVRGFIPAGHIYKSETEIVLKQVK